MTRRRRRRKKKKKKKKKKRSRNQQQRAGLQCRTHKRQTEYHEWWPKQKRETRGELSLECHATHEPLFLKATLMTLWLSMAANVAGRAKSHTSSGNARSKLDHTDCSGILSRTHGASNKHKGDKRVNELCPKHKLGNKRGS